jgi:hypothetical protein
MRMRMGMRMMRMIMVIMRIMLRMKMMRIMRMIMTRMIMMRMIMMLLDWHDFVQLVAIYRAEHGLKGITAEPINDDDDDDDESLPEKEAQDVR